MRVERGKVWVEIEEVELMDIREFGGEGRFKMDCFKMLYRCSTGYCVAR